MHVCVCEKDESKADFAGFSPPLINQRWGKEIDDELFRTNKRSHPTTYVLTDWANAHASIGS